MILESKTGTRVVLDGNEYLYFAGTSYFQLHTHPDLIKASLEATKRFGMGSATSRIHTGTTPLLAELEQLVADFFGTEDAAYLPSGYLSNLAGLKALDTMGLYDLVFIDEDSHYSLQEGALATGKPVIRFGHMDLPDLEHKLEKNLSGTLRPLVATDGLFPLRARLAPIGHYLALLGKYNGSVWIDDAHGVGILGDTGKGSCEELGISSGKVFMGGTLSKAFGAYGGIIPGSAKMIRHVRSGTVMKGSNSPINAAVAAGKRGIKLVREHPELREKLWENTRYLKEGIALLGLPFETNRVPVVSFQLGDASTMQSIHNTLMSEGIYIQYTRYQGAGSEGALRIVVTSEHTREEVDFLMEQLGIAIGKLTQ